MDKKKMVKKLQTAKTVMDFGSSVIQNCMSPSSPLLAGGEDRW